jgi:K+-sensing histidine kinase KdpD
VLSSIHEFHWELTVGEELPEGGSHLVVWDFESEPDLEKRGRIRSPNIVFLVRRENLASLQQQLAGSPARVLLKPLKHSIFRVMVQEIIAASESPLAYQAGTDFSGQERDEMFQSLIEFSVRMQEHEHNRTEALVSQVQRIRTSAATLLGYAKLFSTGQLGPISKEQHEVADRMCHVSRALQRLATSILQDSVGVSAVFAPAVQTVDMRALVDSAVAEVLPVAKLRGIEITSEVEPGTSPLSVDLALIEQVLVKLLDDASRLAPKKGKIAIRGYPVFWDQRVSRVAERVRVERRTRHKAKPNAYRLEVRDNRDSFPQGAAGQNFRNFDNNQGASAHTSPGQNIGLGLCRQIVELHRGQFFAAPGEGACFAFVLPNAGTGPPVAAVPSKPDLQEYLH